MAKLLRLDVAQLTDVGRKREHNEDNMAYVIPKDPAVMARKGALFIVADGMGGHAAGEVASEIAVDTVSNAYYQDDNEDVTTALLNAIRRANAAIHQRAAENMLRSGMGTTCVSAVLRGNMAYIANVGDSRAYLIRRSQIRQVSQDHSWVAEQVRAGLLTEEQARTHAQRNVITRSLGTQTEVEIDVFREVLEEGDTLVLCSDGLSGLVNDEELLRTVEQFVPQESVYHLVERANENGGPDNITAIVSRVQELGVEPPSVRQPVPVGGPELSNEDTARIFAPAGMNVAARNGEVPLPGSPFPYSSGPLALPESDTAPQPALKSRKRHGRLFYPTIALLILFVLAAGFSGFYYFLHTYQNSTITSTLDSTARLIDQASNEVNTHNLPQALQDLSNAQQQLQSLRKNYTLGSSSATRLAQLQTQLANETRLAINSYNQSANITVLPCTKSAPSNLSGETAGTLALVQSGNTIAYYALGQDGKIYQLIQSSNSNGSSQYTLNYPFSLSTSTTNTQITSMVGAKEKIFALSEVVTNNTPGNYTINLLGPGQRTGLQSVRQQPVQMSLAKDGQVPGLITAWDNGNNSFDVYVVLQSPTSSSNNNNATILSYSVDNKGNFGQPKSTSISVSEPISSITATPGQLFLLLEGGEVESLPITNHTLASALIPVLTSKAIAPTLAAGAQNFTTSTPVPTVTSQTASLALSVPGASTATLSAGIIPDASGSPQVHLLIGDPTNHRVLDLTQQPPVRAGGPGSTPTVTSSAQGTNMTLYLAQQYASPGYFNAIKSVAVDPSGTTFILSQNTPGSENLLVVGPNAQSTCAS